MFWIRILGAILAVLAATISSCQAHSTARNPTNYITFVEDAVLVSPAHRVHAHSRFDLTFLLHNGQQKIKLSLEPNPDILAGLVAVRHRRADGSVVDAPPVDRRAHKVFRGTAYVQRPGRSGYREAGWARITVRRDGPDPVFVGAFQVDGDSHHVRTGRTYRELRHPDDPDVDVADDVMVVWRDSDLVASHAYYDPVRQELRRRDSVDVGETCGSDGLSYNARYRALDTRDLGRMHSLVPPSPFSHTNPRRQIEGGSSTGSSVNLRANIGSTVGCPTTRKVALMGVATDCSYTASFDSEQEVRQNIIDQVNTASELYERTFNISLGIQALELSDAACPTTAPSDAPWNVPCGGTTTITQRLSLFSAWRAAQPADTNAYWTLLSTCATGSAVGLAWMGQLCVADATQATASDGSRESVSGANVVVRTSTEWQVLAHEIGHTFGAVHDCIASSCAAGAADTQTCCPLSRATCDANAAFIMNPSTADAITDFSPCSVGNICGALNVGATRSDCLADNRGVTTITGSQCGNGIVEPGEDCDCGGPDGCGDNPCCDPTTCSFSGAAACDPSNEECCTASCQIAAQGTVCRASADPCDPPETCPGGTSSSCPPNVHSPDGDSCGDGLTCASGQCTSRDAQCRSLVGVAANDSSTTACATRGVAGCFMCCNSTRLSPNVQDSGQAYLDGTPCDGGNGRCYNGSCNDESALDQIGSWFSRNKHIIIPVVASVGGLLVLAVAFCCIRSVWRRRQAARAKDPAGQQYETWQAYGGGHDDNNNNNGDGGPPSMPVMPPPPPPRTAIPLPEQQPGGMQMRQMGDTGMHNRGPFQTMMRYA